MPTEIYPVQSKVEVGVAEPGKFVQGRYPENTMCEFVYQSLNTDIATVDPVTGAITAHKVGEAVVEMLRPIREESARIMKDKAYLENVYRDGAQRASYVAEKTLRKVYKKVGFVAK